MCDGVSLMGVMMQMLSRECGGSLVPVRPNNHQARTGLFMNIIYFLFSLWGSIKALLKIAALHFMSDTPTRLSVPEELFSSGRSRPVRHRTHCLNPVRLSFVGAGVGARP